MPYSTAADAVSTGFKGYAGIFQTRRKYDLSDKIIRKSRIVAALWNLLSSNLTKMSVRELEPRILIYTDENDVFAIQNNPGTGTSFELLNEDGQLLQEGDKLYVVPNNITAAPSQETLIVTSVGAPDSGSAQGRTAVTVTRGSSPIDITDGSQYSLFWGGWSTGENQGLPQIRTKEPNYDYNYLELFAKVVGESLDVRASDFYAKEFFSLRGQMTRARDLFAKQVNMTLYLGERDRKLVSDGNYHHFTGGLYEYIPTANKISLSGNMNINYWNSLASLTLFKHGNKRHEKFLFCGAGFAVAIENMVAGAGTYYLQPNEQLSRWLGVKVKTLDLSGGLIHVVREASFLDTGYSNIGFLIDQDFLSYMYLQGRDVKVDQNVTNPSERWNREKWAIYGRIGLFRAYPEAHFFLYNPS